MGKLAGTLGLMALIPRCAWDSKVDAGGAVHLPRRRFVNLIQRNLFVVLGIEIGEDRWGHHVVLHPDGSAAVFEDDSERLIGQRRSSGYRR